MGEISAAGKEQELGIGQINHSIMEMDSVTQQNAALVEEAAAAAESLQEQAAELSHIVRTFQLRDPARIESQTAEKAPMKSQKSQRIGCTKMVNKVALPQPPKARANGTSEQWEEF